MLFAAPPLEDRDRPAAALLVPTFASMAAANVMTASGAKALFVENVDARQLPTMYLVAAACGMALAFLWTRTRPAADATQRFVRFAAACASVGPGVALAAGSAPVFAAYTALTLGSGAAQLLAVQAFAHAAARAGPRQSSRLFPTLSVALTTGAVLGGLTTQVLAWIGGVGAALAGPAPFLLIAAATAHHARRRLPATHAGPASAPQGGVGDSPSRVVVRHPLVRSLAAVAFCTQAASVLLDFQFVSLVKSNLSPAAVPGAFGAFYAVSNGAILLTSAWTGRARAHRAGLGMATAAPLLVYVVAASAAAALTLTGTPGVFAVVITAGVIERVADFAVARQAAHSAYGPLLPSTADRARVLVTAVAGRLGMFVVSGTMLATAVASPVHPAVLIGMLVAAAVGFIPATRIDRQYAGALRDAVRRNRKHGGEEISAWAREAAQRQVRRDLGARDPSLVCAALDLAVLMEIPVAEAMRAPLLRHSNIEVRRRILHVLERANANLPRGEWPPLLDPVQPTDLLAAALARLDIEDVDARPAVRLLSAHPDPTVATLAAIWLSRSGTRSVAFNRPVGDTEWGRRIRDLAGSRDPATLSVAAELVAQMAGGEDAQLLVSRLRHPAERSLLIAALRELPPSTVLPHAVRDLHQGAAIGGGRTMAVIEVLEQCASPSAGSALAYAMERGCASVRDRAIRSLFRRARAGPGDAIPGEVFQRQAARELHDLLAVSLAYDAARRERTPEGRGGLLAELGSRRRDGEMRALRVFGLATSPLSVKPALLAFGSDDPWLRSQALEWLEREAPHAGLRSLILAVEASDARGQHASGVGIRVRSIPEVTPMLERIAAAEDELRGIHDLLASVDPLLAELWQHAFSLEDRVNDDDRTALVERMLTLRAVPLFAEVSADQLLPLAAVAREAAFERGQALFHEGDAGDALYVILSGQVEIRRGPNRVATCGAGECIGEIAVLDARPRSATATATGPTRCLSIGAGDFDDLHETAPGLSRGVIRTLTARVRDLMSGAGPAPGRPPTRISWGD